MDKKLRKGQILLVDGLSVLEWKEWHERDARHFIAMTEKGLQLLTEAGYTLSTSASVLAHLLYGAMIEAALYLANAEDSRQAQVEVSQGIRCLLTSLIQPGEASEKRYLGEVSSFQ